MSTVPQSDYKKKTKKQKRAKVGKNTPDPPWLGHTDQF